MKYAVPAVLALFVFVGCAELTESASSTSRTIQVTGTAQVNVTPDICFVDVTVNTRNRQSASKAYDKNNGIAAEIRAAAESLGIDEKDVKSTSFTIAPQYRWSDSQERSVFDGYLVSHSLRVQVRDLDTVSDVLDAAVTAGAKTVNQVLFTVEHPKEHTKEARTEAMLAARRKAEEFAKLNGVQLGKPITISEAEPGQVWEHAQYRANTWTGADMLLEAEASATLAPGQSSLTHTVYVTYELQ